MLTQEEKAALCYALIDLPPAYDHHHLNADSINRIVELRKVSEDKAEEILERLRMDGLIVAELIPQGGHLAEDRESPAKVRWRRGV